MPVRVFEDASMREAAAILRAGGLVAFPTETVYGLGARADRSEAVLGIYRAKGRPLENPSIVHVADVDAARALARPDARFEALAAALWPGPLTLIVNPLDDVVAPEVMAGGSTLALRVPVHPLARALLRAVALPIAAPSANRSNAISPTTAAHVDKSLGSKVDLILDGGPTGFGIESTIVDLTSDPPRLLRRGSIDLDTLRALVPEIADRGDTVTTEAARAPSPGTYARHYAPDTPLYLVERDELGDRARAARRDGNRAGALVLGAFDGASDLFDAVVFAPRDREGYARELYASLHRLDEASVDVIFVERPPADWVAVHDRLRRAAG